MEAVAEITTEVMNVPALRFPEFEEEWIENRFDDFCTLQRGFDLTKTTSSEGSIPVYSSSGISYFHNTFKVKSPGIVTGRKGVVGNVFFIEEDFWPHDTTLWVKDFHSNYEKFVYWFLLRFKLERFDASTSVPTLNRNNVHGIKIKYPSFPEQKKIADFLSAIDNKIQQLIKKKELLDLYKKGVMQLIFSQQIRFKDKNGQSFLEWEEKLLGEYLIHKTTRNKSGKVNLVLSVSNKKGFITQNEQFDGYVVASKELSNYKVVNRNDIAYNPSRINVGSIARLINFESGIVSPMYVVFSLKENLNSIYFEQIWETHLFKHFVKVGCSGSVRDTLNFEDLCNFKFKFPSIEEQEKITLFLSSIDKKISLQIKQLEKALQFKEGLLQQMII